jgi:signal transduction histidine kinase
VTTSIEPRPTQPPPPPPPGAGPPRGRFVRFTRDPDERIIAGVAGGLARELGVDPFLIRIAFAVLAFAGGVGLLLYGGLWAFVPVGRPQQASARPATAQQAVALALITAGVLGLLRAVGLWFGDGLVLPIVLAAAGSAVVWTRADGARRDKLTRLGGRLTPEVFQSAAGAPVSPVRIVVGTLLVAGAVAGFLAANDALVAAGDLVLAVIAAVGGLGLLFGPWLWRVRTELNAERRRRIRQEEHAEIAAHLHDSVLQTLALIQRSSEQPTRMVALARRQERELRAWLYGDGAPSDGPRSLAEGFAAIVEELEATHDVAVELVTVGDAPIDDRTRALIAAAREATLNAVNHAKVPVVDLYLEVDDTTCTAFVRDRGVGFDPDAVPDDRHGISRSIRERLVRHDGSATITSEVGVGTEVELCIPRHRQRPSEQEST